MTEREAKIKNLNAINDYVKQQMEEAGFDRPITVYDAFSTKYGTCHISLSRELGIGVKRNGTYSTWCYVRQDRTDDNLINQVIGNDLIYQWKTHVKDKINGTISEEKANRKIMMNFEV